MQPFEYQYLPDDVASDFREALTCYAHSCHNAAAAMCRRTIQSVAMNLKAVGTSKIDKQILEAKETSGMDDETYNGLRAVMLGGHDGTHPHLPNVTPQRCTVLIQVMKDVLHELYIRSGRIKEAMGMRQEAIEAKKQT